MVKKSKKALKKKIVTKKAPAKKAKAPVQAKGKSKLKIKAKPVPNPLKTKKIKKNIPVLKSVTRKSVELAPVRAAEEKALSASEINKFRDILNVKQDELSEIVNRKKEEQEFQQEDPEIGDEADIATRSVEKELLFDITDAEKQNLDGIEAALRKIEKGVFGRCESCQRTIPRLRLEVMPWARYCIQCQSKNETPMSAGPIE